ncbi:HPr-rel-A system PqqD family peptide chaperone [Afifella pfennigii]|uniref:HPr-rel-A system PqqD family peptide chaperone n=1 Tax=Afifella pfennigii TaxID=209897 RepID=UPI000553AD06|nr:HPr-rel-A system PqqD family peptide chaperone [Afifella pfennigii]
MSETNAQTTFAPAAGVIVRRQKADYLFYNSRTDELHLVPPPGHAVYAMCDGVRSLQEIAEALAASFEVDSAELRAPLGAFLEQLEARGLVERSDG